MKTITLRQPWASLVALGYKDIENRNWATKFRGQILIHAGMGSDKWTDELRQKYGDLPFDPKELPKGGVIGIATITDCVTQHSSKWFWGKYGFTLEDARPLKFYPCKGALSLWECNYPYEIPSSSTPYKQAK